MNLNAAIELVESFDPGTDELADKSQELILMLLQHSEQPFSQQQYAPGHITATAVVLSPDLRQVLLVHHKKLQRWLLPGGHVEESDVTLEMAALRETGEETGVPTGPGLGLVGMDVHGIPPRKEHPYHQHHDLMFAFRAESLEIRLSDESDSVQWCAIDNAAFDNHALAEPIRRATARARAGFQATSTS